MAIASNEYNIINYLYKILFSCIAIHSTESYNYCPTNTASTLKGNFNISLVYLFI